MNMRSCSIEKVKDQRELYQKLCQSARVVLRMYISLDIYLDYNMMDRCRLST